MVQQCGNAMHVNAVGSVIAAIFLLLPNLGARLADPEAEDSKRCFSSLGYLLHSYRVKRGRLG